MGCHLPGPPCRWGFLPGVGEARQTPAGDSSHFILPLWEETAVLGEQLHAGLLLFASCAYLAFVGVCSSDNRCDGSHPIAFLLDRETRHSFSEPSFPLMGAAVSTCSAGSSPTPASGCCTTPSPGGGATAGPEERC